MVDGWIDGQMHLLFLNPFVRLAWGWALSHPAGCPRLLWPICSIAMDTCRSPSEKAKQLCHDQPWRWQLNLNAKNHLEVVEMPP